MMSFSHVKNAGNAGKYFMESDNYYLQSDEYANHFTWWGNGAKKLNLSQIVSREVFLDLLKGKLPNGKQIPYSTDGKHRAGFDITFSAPKTVSILALVYNDERLIEAHQKAVDAALTEIEKMAAQAKITRNKQTKFELTENLTVARFLHDTSRELDPQLHTHCVVMNFTERADGQWRTLASNTRQDRLKARINGFNETIYQRQIYFSSIYRSELAKNLHDLGFEIEAIPGNNHGMFEIKGIPQEVIDLFSKRRTQIEKKMEEMNLASFKAGDYATLVTRKDKESMDRKELNQNWQEELKTVAPDFKPEKLTTSLARRQQNLFTEEALTYAKQAIIAAAEHFKETRLVFAHTDLISKALAFNLGKCSFAEINQAVTTLTAEHFLLPVKEGGYTTRAILDYEKRLASLIKSTVVKDRVYQVNERYLAEIEVTDRQKNAIQSILSSSGQISLVNIGLNDEPKKFIEGLVNMAEHGGQRVKVLTPTKTYAVDVNKKVGRRAFNAWAWVANHFKPDIAQTVKGYLHENAKEDFLAAFRRGQETLIIDASERLNYQDFEKLLEHAKAKQARLIFLNQADAMKEAGAGNPVDLMRKTKVSEYALIENSKRAGNIKTAIQTIANDEARAKAIAVRYAELTERAQQNTHVIAHSQQQVEVLNQEIRTALKARGAMLNAEVSVNVLVPAYLSEKERDFASQYSRNMVIKHFEGRQVETLRVIKTIKEDNKVILLNEAGDKIVWNPKGNHANRLVFKEESKAITAGDRLVVGSDILRLNLKSGEEFKIEDFKGDEVTLYIAGRKPLTLPLKILENMSFDYAYATTLNRAPVGKRDHVILDTKAFAMNQGMMNEIKARSKKTIDIITDNQERLTAYAEREHLKLTTHDTLLTTLQEMPELTKFITTETLDSIASELNTIGALLNQKFSSIDSRTLVQRALDFAVNKLSEREAAFAQSDLISLAIEHAIQNLGTVDNAAPLTKDEIVSELEKYRQDGRLLANKTTWMTKEAHAIEHDIVRLVKEGWDSQQGLLSKDMAIERLRDTMLSRGQKNAAYMILTNTDRFALIQGDAGTGKTHMLTSMHEVLKEVKACLGEENIEILGLAPTHPAKDEMIKVGIKSQTLKSFLLDVEAQKKAGNAIDFNQKLFVLDEFSMVPNQDVHEFTQVLSEHNGRVIFIGDAKQNQPIAAGKPMSLILRVYNQYKGFIRVIFMHEQLRQKNPDALAIAQHAQKGEIAAAIAVAETVDAEKHIARHEDRMTLNEQLRVHDSVIEVRPQELHHAFAREYIMRTPEVRAQTAFIVRTNRNREIINGLIRKELKQEVSLPKEPGNQLNRLIDVGLTKAEIKEVFRLNAGDVTHLRLGNHYYEILETDGRNQAVLVKDESGKAVSLNLRQDLVRHGDNVGAYRLTQSEVLPNEVIMIRKSDPKRGLYATQEFIVKQVDKTQMRLLNRHDLAEIILDTHHLNDTHWDYGYTKTTHAQQGATRPFTLIFSPSSDDELAHVRNAYVELTRHQNHVAVLTDDKKRIIDMLSRAKNKSSALMATGDISELGKLLGLQNRNAKDAPAEIAEKSEPAMPSKTPVLARLDAKAIEIALNNQVEYVAESLLGQPAQKLGREWRYGSKGSLKIQMEGEARGKWHNFETGEGGNLITLIEKELNMNFKEALHYAANPAGRSHFDLHTSARTKAAPAPSEHKVSPIVARMAKEARPLEGTLAERYLKEYRNIWDTAAHDVKFHPKVFSHMMKDENGKEKGIYHPALVALAKDENGQVTGMQATYLDQETGGKAKNLEVVKRSFGKIAGSLVVVNEGTARDKISFVSESVENAKSIKEIVPEHQQVATLGLSNFKNLNPAQLGKVVVLCPDNDGLARIKNQTLMQAAERQVKAGKEVFIAYPLKEGTDHNDILREGGREALKKELKGLIPFDKWKDILAKENMTSDQLKKTIETLKASELKLKNADHPIEVLAKHLSEIDSKVHNQLKQQIKAVQQSQQIKQPSIKPDTLQQFKNIEKEI